jgi:hypothetical protein
MAKTITWKTKREGQKKHNPQEPKKGELIPVVVGSYPTHSPSNVTYMQIEKFNNNRRFKTNISHQRNLPFYNRG